MKKELVQIAVFKDYARFILDNHIDELVNEDIKRARLTQIPLLDVLSYMSEAELFDFNKVNSIEFLNTIVDGTVIDKALERDKNWREDKIPGIPREKLDIRDIALVNNIKKHSLFKFIPQYTSDISTSLRLVTDIADYYTFTQSLSFQTYNIIHRQLLLESQHLVQQITDSTPDVIQIYDLKEKRNVYVNKEAFLMFGYTPEDLVAMGDTYVQQLVHPHDLPVVAARIEKFQGAKDGEILESEHRVKNKKGEWRWVNSRGTVFKRSDDGEVLQFLSIISDITEKKEAEVKLREAQNELLILNHELEKRVEERTIELNESQNQLTLIINSLPDLISYIGKDFHYKFQNSAYGEWFEGDYREFRNKPMWEVLGQEAFDTLKPHISRALEGEKVKFQAYAPYKNKPRHISGNYVPDVSTHGVVRGIFVLVSDITPVMEAQEQIRENANRFQSLMEAIPTMAWASLPDGPVTYLNKAWYEFTGAKDISEWKWEKFIYPEDADRTMERWHECFEKGIPFDIEYRWVRHDGAIRWMIGRANPIRNQEGEVVLWIGTATDIHEQKQVLEQLELTNHQLQRINNDLDNFIYTASHDLKAPVSNIEGLVNTLKEVVKDGNMEEMDALIMMIEASISRFQGTIKDLTEISRIQKVVQDDILEIDVKKEIEEILLDITGMIKETSSEIKIDTERLPLIKFSKVHFRSILYNLINNAIKYRSNERHTIIKIEAYQEGKEGVFTVSDNGLGIREDQLDKVFSMFKRFHTHVDGTGVGLYIVKRIIENAGGTIKVESCEGVGTTFTATLPLEPGK